MKISVYTDGACSNNPGPGGWGALFLNKNSCEELSGHEISTTNNRMELMAVVESLKKISDDNNKRRLTRAYDIYSDSAYVVNSIVNGWVDVWKKNGWVTTRGEDIKNRDLWEKYLEYHKRCLQQGLLIKIIKVKGHAGNSFNEHVDALAKEEVTLARKEAEQS